MTKSFNQGICRSAVKEAENQIYNSVTRYIRFGLDANVAFLPERFIRSVVMNPLYNTFLLEVEWLIRTEVRKNLMQSTEINAETMVDDNMD